MRYLYTFIVSTLISISSFSQAKAKDLANSGRFRFIATSITSGTAGATLLDPPYDVIVKGDTLISDLPYKGISRSTRPDAGNIKFTSYHVSKIKKDSKNASVVSITMADQHESGTFEFTIEKNGTTTLVVTSIIRDPATYNGYIREL